MEKRIKKLEEEVACLKAENESLKQTQKQLIEESKVESYDARRSLMLKSQIIQLERQCMLLNDAVSSRTDILVETENALISLIQEFQGLLGQKEPGPLVKVSRKQLISNIQQMQRLKGSLYKQQILSSSDRLKIPQLTGCKFSNQPNLTCIDICKADAKHLNLVNVSKLEDELAKLYKKLHSLQAMLEIMIPSAETKPPKVVCSASKYLFSNSFEKLKIKCDECKCSLEKSCQDLLSVSLLYPSAPWTVIQHPEKFGAFAPSAVLSGIAPNVRRRSDVKSAASAVCKAHSYLTMMHKLELAAVKTELSKQSDINAIYSCYVEDILKLVLEAYNQCEQKLIEFVCKPMESILSAWVKLKNSQSDNALRQFLSCVKENEDAMRDFVNSNDSETLNDPFNDLRQKFLDEIQLTQEKCAKNAKASKSELLTHREDYEDIVLEALKKLRLAQTDS